MYQVGTTLIVGASPDLVELGQRLGHDGERIALLARTASRLAEFKLQLTDSGVDCESFTGDVTETDSVLMAFQRFAAWSPRLDRLIYNVGINSYEAASELTTSALHKVMSANFFGFVNCLQLAMPMFKRTGNGHAITISSTRALHGEQPVAYAASKAALRIYSAALRKELNDYAFSLSEVFLGHIREGTGRRNLSRDEIVEGLTSTIFARPDRLVIGEIGNEIAGK